MTDEREIELIEKALDIFMKYGIKAVTMDEMARHLGISKKTLYNHVNDKSDLLRKALSFAYNKDKEQIQGIVAKGLNAIDEKFEIGRYISGMLKEVHPSIHYDLERYHPELLNDMICEHDCAMDDTLKNNLLKGIEEGYYREDLNVDVIAKLYVAKVNALFDRRIFPPAEISFNEAYKVLFRYHIMGVASPKGADYVQEKINEIKNAEQ